MAGKISLQNDMIDWIKKQYPKAWICKKYARFAGEPDILVCKNGIMYAIVVQFGMGSVSLDSQKRGLEEIRIAGGYAGKNIEDVEVLLASKKRSE